MTILDWVLVAFVALTALAGLRSGLVATLLSLGGLTAGAVAGARVATSMAASEGDPGWISLIALGGAIAGALLLRLVAGVVGASVRGGLRFVPPLRWLDSAGGLVLGAAWGIALVWVGAAVAAELPGLPEVHDEVDRSAVVRRLNDVAPPPDVLELRARLDELRTPAPAPKV